MNREVFRDNVVVITGASRGIGREMALQLAGQGARLVVSAEAGDLEGLAVECRGLGAEAVAVLADVTDEAQCARLIAEAVDTYGRLDTLINNAGITMWSPFEEVKDLSILEKVMRVNYLGSVYCTGHALPHLKASRGRIVAMASLAGKTGLPTRSGYAASKHAVVGFFDTLRMELSGTGVSVTVACPDFVDTEIRRHALGAESRPASALNDGAGAMSAEECARLVLEASAARKRELITNMRGRGALWLRLLWPSLLDRMATRAVARI